MRAGVPDRRVVQAQGGRHRAGGLRQVHRLQILLLGLPYGVREIDEHQKVMKKCTLCVDRIYDQSLPEAERKPACVLACPTSARLFGDVHDPDSAVSVAIRENGGYPLMPEWGTKPSNHYLPRRKTQLRIHDDELVRADNPLKKERLLPKPDKSEPSLDDVTSW